MGFLVLGSDITIIRVLLLVFWFLLFLDRMSSDRLERLASFFLDASKEVFPETLETPAPHEESSAAASHKRKFDEIESDKLAGCLVQGCAASHNAWRWKVQQCDPRLLQLPNLHTAMQELNASSGNCFDLRLPKVKLASAVLQHCIALVACVAAQGAMFKVGITTNPAFRWSNSSFGYAGSEIYKKMVIMAIVRTMEAAAFLEAALIREFRDHPACQNEAAGGEGAVDSSPGFVYLVHSDFGACSAESRRSASS